MLAMYAVGLVCEHAKLTEYAGNTHIFTDSTLTKDALCSGWSAGKSNQLLLRALRKKLRELNNCAFNFNWVPGHSGIPQNELADALAGADRVTLRKITQRVLSFTKPY